MWLSKDTGSKPLTQKTFMEIWLRGRKRLPAKKLTAERWSEGSNPSISANNKDRYSNLFYVIFCAENKSSWFESKSLQSSGGVIGNTLTTLSCIYGGMPESGLSEQS